jgi:gamma-glutamyltranspeptidase
VLRKPDFEGYRAVYRSPVNLYVCFVTCLLWLSTHLKGPPYRCMSSKYRNMAVYGMNAPASGGLTLALMLHQLQNFDLSR